MVARRHPGQRDEVVEQLVRIIRSYPVIAVSGLLKHLPQPLALSIRMHRASMPPMIRTAAGMEMLPWDV
jgi:hypothetical protein